MRNRSVPVDTLLPHVVYRDVDEAVPWLTRTFRFTERYRYGEPVSGALVHLDDACIMLIRSGPGEETPARLGCETQSLTVFVDDVEAHYERARSAGATIVEDLHVTV